ncbi:ImmA/IrrE family metallo-endopeptidase [Vibrio parahaemolyticus]|uniref:ImmA/IrrE family metallo-endopeptidase n=1 Tax=Vibrio TaxID=662 RepID=UPI0004D54C0C|nr:MULTISPECIES: ImmA/IrrE family metallo-endopeptidase [Vibrio]EGQ7896048.1 ImmA/IrrE family metallo-endopeptidase [Vibrio parahaemolyticus]EGQ8481345.1 ImmA/IrrE family metallo-endopeptidase [Vibrio parahaemolyticus]EGR1284119.1 ImmA/IrrE family metallo-endopeptidase [Vibrio parahaemolyticus]EGR1793160.1 ImmA/IrrE family metallo-endopeptidase [Vibrio parahaemolyticus]EGR1938065.1 ImmA/IrrE family metallo-endopeptidase [Vibrio parahaemolyticus]
MLITVNKKITFSEISEITSAQDVLKKVYGDLDSIELPIDIDLIINSIEGVSLSEELDLSNLNTAGFIHVKRDNENNVKDVRIWTNPTEADTRMRFTKAHEVGHLVFDIFPSLNDTNVNEEFIERLNRKEGSNSYIEQRANRFAAQLLMPAQLVKKEVSKLVSLYKKQNKKISLEQAIEELASKFDTSKDAMKFRLKNLNIIS